MDAHPTIHNSFPIRERIGRNMRMLPFLSLLCDVAPRMRGCAGGVLLYSPVSPQGLCALHGRPVRGPRRVPRINKKPQHGREQRTPLLTSSSAFEKQAER